jgi:hypothetical protein
MNESPTGHILVNGVPMAFWLPEGMRVEELELNVVTATDQGSDRLLPRDGGEAEHV